MTLSDLPVELEWEILSKVPAKSLTQLRSTCKRWYALFKDPRFIKKNMEKAATQLILKMNRINVYSVNINLPNKSIEFTGQLKSPIKDQQRVSISGIFHCDGLLLLCTMRSNNVYVLVVWNPCTGQTRRIKPPRSFDCYLSYDYALGYDNNNSYKILRIRSYKVVLQIYEFSSNSWRVLEDVTDHKWIIISRQVSLKGNSYWIAWDNNKEYPNNKFLLKFDFERETFESLSLPSECNNNDQELNVVLSTVGQERLSVLLEKFIVESSLEIIKIWVTDTTKIQYSLIVDSGMIMRQSMKCVDSFLVDEENKRVVCCGPCGDNGEKEESVVIYFVRDQDPKNNVCTKVYGTSAEVLDVYSPYLLSYVPSLVQIQISNKRKRCVFGSN